MTSRQSAAANLSTTTSCAGARSASAATRRSSPLRTRSTHARRPSRRRPQGRPQTASALTQYQKTVTDAAKSVQSALSSADWNDSQKQQFEARLKQLNGSVRRFMDSDVKEMITGLNKLASQLEAVRQIRM